MQNLLQISPNPGASSQNASSQAASGLNQTGASNAKGFDQVLETSISGVQSVGDKSAGNSFTPSDLDTLNLSKQQLSELKALLKSMEGKEFADLDGASFPILENFVAELEGLLNGIEGLETSPSFEGSLSDLQSFISSNSLDSVESFESLVSQIQTFIDALPSEVIEENPLIDEISASVAAISAGIAGNAQQSVNVAPVSEQSLVIDQGSRNVASDYSLSGAATNVGNNVGNNTGQGSASNGGGTNGETSEKLFDSFLQKTSTVEGAKDSELTFSDQIKSVSNKLGITDVQPRLLGGSDRAYATTLPGSVFEPEWGDELSQKIVWLTSREIKSAEIHLNPAELGPIDVKVSVQSENATVNINAQNSTVRELLESQVTRLREMMEQNGISLDDVNVGAGEQEQMAQQHAESNDRGAAGGSDDSLIELDENSDSDLTAVTTSNLVDFYA